ncbi:hypothetical protein ANN_12583 [Periplaneta americana]|uniref:Uncharacterized protein n=1 Tax=Periplaneta americana TaxID=6978 RepID=A0ABQ8TIW5_PERAM|nr:hypothetical protein ANN_12583 [Periplaneta americana]
MCWIVESNSVLLFCQTYDVVYYVWIVSVFLCYEFDCVHFFIVVLLVHGPTRSFTIVGEITQTGSGIDSGRSDWRVGIALAFYAQDFLTEDQMTKASQPNNNRAKLKSKGDSASPALARSELEKHQMAALYGLCCLSPMLSAFDGKSNVCSSTKGENPGCHCHEWMVCDIAKVPMNKCSGNNETRSNIQCTRDGTAYPLHISASADDHCSIWFQGINSSISKQLPSSLLSAKTTCSAIIDLQSKVDIISMFHTAFVRQIRRYCVCLVVCAMEVPCMPSLIMNDAFRTEGYHIEEYLLSMGLDERLGIAKKRRNEREALIDRILDAA